MHLICLISKFKESLLNETTAGELLIILLLSWMTALATMFFSLHLNTTAKRKSIHTKILHSFIYLYNQQM